MNRLLRMPSSYLGIPMLFSCGVTLLTYDLPTEYLIGIALLTALAMATVAMDLLLGVRLPPLQRFRERQYAGTRESFLALALAAWVAVFCVLDLVLFPVPIFNDPSSYATLSPLHTHIRHLSNICWVLPPIALLCIRNKPLRYQVVAIGFLFPVLVIDRNRLLASLFSFAVLIVLRRDAARPLPWKTILLLAFAGAAAFSVLGTLRSGSIESVALPFSDLYRAAPQGVEWLLLYISAGPYNFSAILAKEYENANFLVNQLVPMSGSIATAGTDIPLDASNINVGTEFFPFLMAWGASGAVAALLALYAALLWSVRRLGIALSLFPLLIFLRIAYTCLMSPFAPQAFTWTNLGFIGMCLTLHAFTVLLPDRNAAAQAGLPRPVLFHNNPPKTEPQ
ncbi:hypothetical protein [Pseudoxanthomonas sp. UTMC 1351]|uniref:hypothetical protein n=1 Tax=Pseudoxanthomonas sp. UTMC 1351 TaxID=2695853 RepID=UPI0034CE4B7C